MTSKSKKISVTYAQRLLKTNNCKKTKSPTKKNLSDRFGLLFNKNLHNHRQAPVDEVMKCCSCS